MPGTVDPIAGVQGFWARLQELRDRLTSLETWVRQPRTARGIATLTFTASANSAALVVSHGLPSAPAAVVASAFAAPAFGQIPICNTFTYTATTFSLDGQTTSAFTGTVQVAWFASL